MDKVSKIDTAMSLLAASKFWSFCSLKWPKIVFQIPDFPHKLMIQRIEMEKLTALAYLTYLTYTLSVLSPHLSPSYSSLIINVLQNFILCELCA